MCRVIPALCVLSVACGSRDHAASPPLDVGMSSVAVMKARRAHDDHLLLLQTLTPIADVERPRRLLRRFRSDGGRLDYVAPEGASLADFTIHPGGEASILLESDVGYALERWLPDGTRGGSVEVPDLAPTAWSRDSGRAAAIGDDVVLAVRAADNSVHAYRYAPDAAGYRRIWEVVVEPANDLFPAGLISGSFDTFGQLRNSFRVYVDVGSDGALWVAVPVDPSTDLLFEHNAAFGDDLRFIPGASASSDALLTRLDGAGRRVFSRMAGTQSPDQIYGMRAVVGGVLVAGRSQIRQGDAGGWDGLLAHVADDGAVSARTVDISAGDVFFDADVLFDGRTVAVGGSGYTDNPAGGSISEDCSLLAVVLTDDAQSVLSLPALPRHNEVRTLLVDATTVWIAGMSDGPGTHSGDGDPSAIRAEPFVANLVIP